MEVETMKSDVGMSWKKMRLVDVCDFQGGTQPPKSEWITTPRVGYVRMIQIRDFTQGKESFIEYVKDSKTLKKCQEDDIMIGRYGASIGKILTGISGAYNVALVKTIPSDELDKRYFFHYLNTTYFQNFIQNAGSRAAQAGFNKEELKDLEIPLPPLSTQKRIAEILDAADALRRKDQELLKKYDELAQAIFIDMFGDPVKNEKGWETKQFKDLGTLDRGISKHRPRNAPELLGGDYPLIQTGDVANSGGIITKYKATYSELGLKQSKLWAKGTLCITIAANIAKTGILNFDACFPDSIVGFKPNRSLSNSVFIQFWIGFLQKILEDNAPESAQKNINLEILRGLYVICPPIDLQNDFANKIYLLQNIKDKSSLNKDDVFFDSLIQKAFEGELV